MKIFRKAAGKGTIDERVARLMPSIRDLMQLPAPRRFCRDCGESHRTVADALACDDDLET
jgi:hypothetical protein